jgi:DNA-directed RNA polymerase specialized sigma24 family protein
MDDAWTAAVETPPMTVALADALDDLERKDPLKARLVEMRYFGGLTLEESAEVAGITFESVRYELRLAQAWLSREMSAAEGSSAK